VVLVQPVLEQKEQIVLCLVLAPFQQLHLQAVEILPIQEMEPLVVPVAAHLQLTALHTQAVLAIHQQLRLHKETLEAVLVAHLHILMAGVVAHQRLVEREAVHNLVRVALEQHHP
jgi:hypothetical protein